MFFFKDYVKRYNIDNQLPNCTVFATSSYLTIDDIDFRISVYGWPDNRVAVSDKISGVNTIKRFGPKGRYKCETYLKSCLEILGVEFPEEE
jgi:hypothetical protein